MSGRNKGAHLNNKQITHPEADHKHPEDLNNCQLPNAPLLQVQKGKEQHEDIPEKANRFCDNVTLPNQLQWIERT